MASTEHRVFLSYRHGTLTPSVEKFHNKLRVNGRGMGLAGSFMDAKAIAAGQFWRGEVEQALARATRFVAFLEDDYWLSDECQKELQAAVDRYSTGDGLQLLFVKAGEIDPALLLFDDLPNGSAAPKDQTRRQLKRVGDLEFLGPKDEATQRLVTLAPFGDPRLDGQLFQLLKRLQATLG